MLVAMKNAKKNKEQQNNSDGAEGEQESSGLENAATSSNGSILAKPVSSSRSVNIDKVQSSVVPPPGRAIEKTKSQQ